MLFDDLPNTKFWFPEFFSSNTFVCLCSHDAMGQSVVCDCRIPWSYSLAVRGWRNVITP